ncbi:hypothetical protein GJ496_003761 [Pomphorhynchus laevis]|nr:hypothetical protein GJ496_003761 [Pomphorhynchus laevis]
MSQLSRSTDQDEDDPILRELQHQVSGDQQIVIVTSEDGENQYFIVNKDQDWNTLLEDSGLLTIADPNQRNALISQLSNLHANHESSLGCNTDVDSIQLQSMLATGDQNAEIVEAQHQYNAGHQDIGSQLHHNTRIGESLIQSRKRRRPYFENDEHNSSPDSDDPGNMITNAYSQNRRIKQESVIQPTSEDNSPQEYYYLPSSDHIDNAHMMLIPRNDAYDPTTNCSKPHVGSRYDPSDLLLNATSAVTSRKANNHALSAMVDCQTLSNIAIANQQHYNVDEHSLIKDTFSGTLEDLDLDCVFRDLRAKDTINVEETSIAIVDEIPPLPLKFIPKYEQCQNSFQNVFLQFLANSIDETRNKYQSVAINEN